MKVYTEKLGLGSNTAPVHFLCGYIPGYPSTDALSRSLMSFKYGRKNEVAAWTHFALEAFSELDLSAADIIIRPFAHEEMNANRFSFSKSPLTMLCRAIADKYGAGFQPDLIEKKRVTKSLKGMGRDSRTKELSGVYRANPANATFSFRKIWMIDDVLTTGTTARAVWKALKTVLPDVDFNVFALARTTHDDGFNADSEWNITEQSILRENPMEYLSEPITPQLLQYPHFDNKDTYLR